MSTPTQQGPQEQQGQQRAGGGRPGAMTMAMQAVSARPNSGPKVLRIGVIQGDKMVEERIVRRRETVTVGASEKNHFIVAGLPGSFELFQLVGGDYILNFTDAMRGRVGLAGGVEKLENLRASGAARNAGQYLQVKLSDTSRGRVTIGDTTLLFQFIDAPPVQPRPQLPAAVVGGFAAGIDWMFTAVVMFSFMTHFGFVIFLENADWPMSPAIATIPDAVADLIFNDPPAPEPEPEPTETTEPTEAEEPTEVAEAETSRPQQPTDTSSSSSSNTPSERQAAADTDARMVASEAAAQVENMLLGAFGSEGSAFNDVLRAGAVTGSAEDIMAQAEGVGVAQGTSGGVLRERGGGTTVGGGGSDLGGLRRTEGGGATQQRQEGTEVQERVVRARPMRFEVEEDGGSGDFDPAVVTRMIRQRQSAIQACYERELRQNPTLAGRVVVGLTIQTSGSVSNVRATENSTGSDAVATCVVRVIQGFRFNPGPTDGSVSYSFPFVFAPQT